MLKVEDRRRKVDGVRLMAKRNGCKVYGLIRVIRVICEICGLKI